MTGYGAEKNMGEWSAWDLDSFCISLWKIYAENSFSAILGWNCFGFKGVEKLGCLLFKQGICQ